MSMLFQKSEQILLRDKVSVHVEELTPETSKLVGSSMSSSRSVLLNSLSVPCIPGVIYMII